MKRFKRIACVLLSCAIASVSVACGGDDSKQTQTQTQGKTLISISDKADNAEFTKYCDGIFNELVTASTISMNRYISNPDKFGIKDYKVQIDDMDITKYNDASDLKRYLEGLKKFNRDDLSAEQQLVYDDLMTTLNTSINNADNVLLTSSISPTIGMQVQLPLIFEEYTFRKKSDFDEYLTLIEQTDDYFKYMIEFEKLRAKEGYTLEDSILDTIIANTESFIESMKKDNYLVTSFNAALNDFQGLTDDEIAKYKAANEKALSETFLPAYEYLVKELKALKGSNKYAGGMCNKPGGKAYYEFLLQDNIGWSKTVPEFSTLVDQYLSSHLTNATRLMISDPDIPNSLESFKFAVNEPKAGLEDLKEKIKKDFPPLEEVNYTIKSMDKSLEDFASPAMYFIPAIDDYALNYILINNKELTNSTMYMTLSHEGYPGHLYQTIYSRSVCNNNLRFIICPDGYTEGWASYAELYSYSYSGNSDALSQVMAYDRSLTLLLYAKVDMGINYYGWDKAAVANFLKNYGIQDNSEVVDEMYASMVAEPGNYCSYAIGSLGFITMLDEAKSTLGDRFDAVAFHKFIMDVGPTSFDQLHNRFDVWLSKQK